MFDQVFFQKINKQKKNPTDPKVLTISVILVQDLRAKLNGLGKHAKIMLQRARDA